MYGTVAGADTYHSDRGATGWTGDEAAKTAALFRGSEWLWGTYHSRYVGGMPDVYDPGDIPIQLEYAAYEAALAELTSAGSLTQSFIPAQMVKKSQVGPLSKEYFEPKQASDILPVLPKVEHLMAAFLYPSGFPAVMVV